jgi:translocation and assembly module TamA
MDVSAVMDTRDSPINPTRGMFLSVNVVLAPKFLRSDFDYVREFVQSAFLMDFTDTITWAHGYSFGMIHTFGGQRLPFDELFKAGGPNTMRGFALDSLGPATASGETLGGEAVLVVNQELRYTHPVTGLGGALFYDVGNVFETAADFGRGLRHNVGVGLRWESSFGLFRVDVGVPLGRRIGERGYQIYFGFGQAF